MLGHVWPFYSGLLFRLLRFLASALFAPQTPVVLLMIHNPFNENVVRLVIHLRN
jgi:hypothetical protein